MTSPKSVVIVGAGIVGLSVAWFLQDYGIEVTVLDRTDVAAGSSWANAGWLSPGLATPLPEPSILRYGLKSLLDTNAPLYIPFSPNFKLASFLVKFSRHCTEKKWYEAMRAYIAMNNEALGAYDEMALVDNALEFHEAPIMATFQRKDQAKDLLKEFEMIRSAGQSLTTQELSGKELRSKVPQLSNAVDFGIRIEGQRYVNPGLLTKKLGESIVSRGAKIVTDVEIDTIQRINSQIVLHSKSHENIVADTAVIATGAWLDKLARPLGVKMSVQPGRGYSFSVPTEQEVPFPIYFPKIRVACTPMGNNSLRVAGTMEFRHLDAQLNSKRIASIVRSCAPLFKGVDLDNTTQEWVGPRPVTADGMPLIGETKLSGVYIAGGHGMWGMTLGPVTGKLLAAQIIKNEISPHLDYFNPLR